MVVGGRGCTLILFYISRFGPFLEFQNFEFHFYGGGGGVGEGGVRKINMFGFDEIMIIFGAFWGVISIHLGFFRKVKVQILENVFGVALYSLHFWG